MTGCRVSYSVDELRGGMDCDGDADASTEYLARMWREHEERKMTAKTKAERLAESRARTNWLALEVAIDDLRVAAKKRDADGASMAFEVVEEAMSHLVIGEAPATDAD